MKQSSVQALTVLLIAVSAFAVIATVSATATVSVYIMDPTNSANGSLGQTSNSHWVGQIPIKITSGPTTTQTQSYCMNFDRDITIGGTYSATLASAADNTEWKAVSYLLTWNNPATNSDASANAVAIWRLLNQTRGTTYYRQSWLSTSIDNAGNQLATAAYGKDVARQGDTLAWVSPITGNMSSIQGAPNQTYTFIAKLTTSNGAARPNVKILFNATLTTNGQTMLLNSPYISASSAYTDSQGYAQVQITVPSDANLGAMVSVSASTKGVWPQRYIDVTTSSAQDLIGIGETMQLTVQTHVSIYGFITVLPESPIGPIAAIGGFGAGFVVWVKIKKPKLKQ